MTQLIVNVEDDSLLADLKEAILLLRGVGSVTEAIEGARTEEAVDTINTGSYDAFVNSISKKCGLDEALDDVKEGRVSDSFLLKLVHEDKEEGLKKFPISDKVKSLATRVQKETQNIDWEKEKEEYLMQKYGL